MKSGEKKERTFLFGGGQNITLKMLTLFCSLFLLFAPGLSFLGGVKNITLKMLTFFFRSSDSCKIPEHGVGTP